MALWFCSWCKNDEFLSCSLIYTVPSTYRCFPKPAFTQPAQLKRRTPENILFIFLSACRKQARRYADFTKKTAELICIMESERKRRRSIFRFSDTANEPWTRNYHFLFMPKFISFIKMILKYLNVNVCMVIIRSDIVGTDTQWIIYSSFLLTVKNKFKLNHFRQ